VQIPITSLERVAFCDPASGHQTIKRTRARSAIIVIGMDYLTRFFVLLAWAGRPTTTKLVEKLIEVGSTYKPRRFGIESNAMQSLFADLVSAQAKELQKRIPFVPVPQPTKIDKDWRIRTTIQPIIASGRLFVMDNQVELISELAIFPMGVLKDLVDCLASAIALAPKRAAPQAQKSEVDALARYLRDTGATPAHIEQRIRELELEAAAKATLAETEIDYARVG